MERVGRWGQRDTHGERGYDGVGARVGDPEEVYSDLCALADELLSGSTEIALLDFVDLQDPDDYTHRILVGTWLSIGLGIRVEEYRDER